MNVFYVPQCEFGNSFVMDENESNHCVRVLRLKTGDKITLIDGKGGIHAAQILDAHPKKCLVQIDSSRQDQPLTPKIHIAIAPTKSIERTEWFIEKCVEIGISEITPVFCEKSERKNVNSERLEKVLVAAMKQSLQLYKPLLNQPMSLSHFLETSNDSQKCIAHCAGDNRILLKKYYNLGSDITILIGPEGDFSSKEVEKAMKKGYAPVSLGTSRLRTETAGVVACHTIRLLNE